MAKFNPEKKLRICIILNVLINITHYYDLTDQVKEGASMIKEAKQPKDMKQKNPSVKKRPFVEPKLQRHEKLIESTLFPGGGVSGVAAVLS